MDLNTTIILVLLILMSLAIVLLTIGYFLYIKKKNYKSTNIDNKASLRLVFSENSEIGEMIDSIKLCELSNSGKALTKRDEELEAKSFATFLKSDTNKALSKYLEDSNG